MSKQRRHANRMLSLLALAVMVAVPNILWAGPENDGEGAGDGAGCAVCSNSCSAPISMCSTHCGGGGVIGFCTAGCTGVSGRQWDFRIPCTFS
jgi:hypothetical protein